MPSEPVQLQKGLLHEGVHVLGGVGLNFWLLVKANHFCGKVLNKLLQFFFVKAA